MQQAQLYERHVSPAGKISYRLHQPRKEQVLEIEIDNKQLATLTATIGTCLMMSFEKQLPVHSAMARKIQKNESAIQELASLTGKELDARMIDIGVAAWNSAMNTLAKELSTC